MMSPLSPVPARRWITALALAALCGSAAAAPTAKVTVQADEAGLPVNPRVTQGYNFGNWMALADVGEQLARTPAGSLRFPGGNVGDENDMNEVALNAFQSLLTLVKGQPELVIHTRVFGSRGDRPAANTPADAANAVRWARERNIKAPIWEIGNEPDLYSITRGDASWTPERYCEVFRAQAQAIKAVDPSIQIAGPATSGSHIASMRFIERFLVGCGDVVDVLTWHIYPTEGDGTEAAALSTIAQVDESVQRVRAMLRDPKGNPLGHTREVKLGVTEYGLSWKTDRPRFLSDMPAALWAAETALRLSQHGVLMAHYFAYQGTGFHGLVDNSGFVRPTYYAFGMLAGLQGHYVKASSSEPLLWSHAVRNSNQLQLLLLNTQDRPLVTDLDVNGWQPRKASYFDAAIVDDEAKPKALPARKKLTLPARSMTLVQLQKSP